MYRQPYKPSETSLFSSLPWMTDFILADDQEIRNAFSANHPKFLVSLKQELSSSKK
jgi:hypothetical protein